MMKVGHEFTFIQIKAFVLKFTAFDYDSF